MITQSSADFCLFEAFCGGMAVYKNTRSASEKTEDPAAPWTLLFIKSKMLDNHNNFCLLPFCFSPPWVFQVTTASFGSNALFFSHVAEGYNRASSRYTSFLPSTSRWFADAIISWRTSLRMPSKNSCSISFSCAPAVAHGRSFSRSSLYIRTRKNVK